MWHVNNETIWKNNKLKSLSFKFHYMWHLIPAKTNKSSVIFRNIFSYNNVWLKIRFPLYLNVEKIKDKNHLCKGSKSDSCCTSTQNVTYHIFLSSFLNRTVWIYSHKTIHTNQLHTVQNLVLLNTMNQSSTLCTFCARHVNMDLLPTNCI